MVDVRTLYLLTLFAYPIATTSHNTVTFLQHYISHNKQTSPTYFALDTHILHVRPSPS